MRFSISLIRTRFQCAGCCQNDGVDCLVTYEGSSLSFFFREKDRILKWILVIYAMFRLVHILLKSECSRSMHRLFLEQRHHTFSREAYYGQVTRADWSFIGPKCAGQNLSRQTHGCMQNLSETSWSIPFAIQSCGISIVYHMRVLPEVLLRVVRLNLGVA